MSEKMVGMPWKMILATDADIINALPAIVDMPASSDDSVGAPALAPPVADPQRQTHIRKVELQKTGGKAEKKRGLPAPKAPPPSVAAQETPPPLSEAEVKAKEQGCCS